MVILIIDEVYSKKQGEIGFIQWATSLGFMKGSCLHGEDSGLLHFPQVTRTQEWLKNGFEDEVQAGTWLFFLAECWVVEGFLFLEINKNDTFLRLKNVFGLDFGWFFMTFAAQFIQILCDITFMVSTFSENHSFGFSQKWQLQESWIFVKQAFFN